MVSAAWRRWKTDEGLMSWQFQISMCSRVRDSHSLRMHEKKAGERVAQFISRKKTLDTRLSRKRMEDMRCA